MAPGQLPSGPPLKQPLLGEAHTPSPQKAAELAAAEESRRLMRAIFVSLVLMMVEVVGGLMANSLAIVTDAMHLMSDVGGFALSLLTLSVMRRQSTAKYSYGYQQAGVLGGLLSVLIVWLMAGALMVQAIHRMMNPEPINGKLMSIIATLGLVANLVLMAVLGHGHSHGGGHGHSHGDAKGHGHEEHGHGHGHGCDADEEQGHGGHSGHGGHGGHGGHSDHGGHDAHGDCHSDHGGHGHEEHGHAHGNDGGSHGADGHEESRGHGHDQGHDDSHGHGKGNTEAESQHDEASLVMRAAMVHVIGDLVQSAGVMLAGFLIWLEPVDIGHTESGLSKWCYADPLCTFGFSILVVLTTIGTVRQAVMQVMMTVPDHVNATALKRSLLGIEHVVSVHDLHVWQVGQSLICTGHVIINDVLASMKVLEQCTVVAQDKHRVGHTTFQLEVDGQFDHSIEHLTLGGISCHDVHCNEGDQCRQ